MSDLDPERRNAGAALALLSLIWGYNWVAMKTGLADAGPFQFATLRFTLAALCMIPVLIIGSLLLVLGWACLEPQPIRWSLSFGLALGYTAVLATGVAWMPFYYALKRAARARVTAGARQSGFATVVPQAARAGA